MHGSAVVLFPSDPFAPRKVDEAYLHERDAADSCGVAWTVVDHDALDRSHDGELALRRSRLEGVSHAVYRGWMMHAEDYARLHAALARRGVAMLVDPAGYRACHHWPETYPHVERFAALTRWIDQGDMSDPARLQQCLEPFGTEAVILKDWIKSQSGYWDEACYMPDASDGAAVGRVVARFLELQADSLVGGLCFRRHHQLVAAPDGRPAEWRVFAIDGQPIGIWPRAEQAGAPPPADLVAEVCRVMPSRFATADFSCQLDGGWLLIEVGDGGVSGLPASADPGLVLQHAVAAASEVTTSWPAP